MKAGTFLGGGSQILIWLLILSAALGWEPSKEVLGMEILRWFLVATSLLALGVMGYRSLKARAGGMEIEASTGEDALRTRAQQEKLRRYNDDV